MPRKPPTPCTWPQGCPALVEGGGRCPQHQRPNAAARGYDARWARAAHRHLRSHPTCEQPACWQPSTEVDHIDGLGPLGPRGYDPTNWQALCKPHHSAKTARQTGGWHTR